MCILIMVKFMFYIKCFFVYSIFGYLFETITSYFRKTNFSSGILYGFWTPIYGVGVDIILILSNFVFINFHLEKWREGAIVFLIVTFLLTFLEWVSGTMIEKIFNITFWNYKKDFQYTIGKYIAVEVSLIWGLLSLLLVYLIHPIISKYILLVPNILIYIFIIIFFIDLILSFIKLKNRKN